MRFAEDKYLNHKEETFEDLLIPIFRQGKPVYDSPPLSEIQQFAFVQLQKLPQELKTLKPTAEYPVIFKDLK